jgi:hypothetical protein
MLDVWFSEQPSDDPQDRENIAHLGEIESSAQAAPETAASEAKPRTAKRSAKR